MILHSAEIIIYIIIGILGGTFVTLAVLNVRNERKHDMNYQKYVESIQIGDTFGHNNFKLTCGGNPFSESYDSSDFDSRYCITILDIKKNNKGHIWVKYCFTWQLNNMNRGEWTDPIEYILSYYTRISRRIDNINTED